MEHVQQPAAAIQRQRLALGVMVFLAAGTLAFSVMVAVRVRSSVKRRTARILDETYARLVKAQPALFQPQGGAAACSNTPTSTIRPSAAKAMKVLRQRLMQAGIFDPRAVAKFFLVRTVAGGRHCGRDCSSSCR